MDGNILIVDDEADIRNLVKGILEDEGYGTRMAANAKEAYETIAARTPDLIILDIWLEGSEHDGLKILEKVKEKHKHMPIIMISGHGTIETAVSAIKKGAYDFIEKPFKSDRLLLMIQRALETARLKIENEQLRLKAEVASDFIGASPVIQNLQQTLKRVAQTNSRVLLTGEPGTGKDLAARMIHRNSKRVNGPFLVMHCASMRPERLEMELFGSKEGVMGEPAKTGLLEQADGGTLLLDEVADMPLETQSKIVRILQEQRFQKVGSDKFIEVDVRVIASTCRNLEKRIEEGAFRQDLYYRLNVVPVEMPSLRKHPNDIPALTEYFIDLIARQSGLNRYRFTKDAFAALQTYEWPGNVRQLRNTIEWAMIMCGGTSGDEIDANQLPPEISKTPVQTTGAKTVRNEMMEMPLREAREIFERDYLISQINRFDGNVSKTAQFVGMERSALHRKLKSLQIAGSEKQEDSAAGEELKQKRA
jgi:two-component system nitrogen regulation response regulator NtrX